jgi:hypothetical protein
MKLELLTNATVVDDAITVYLIDQKRNRKHLLVIAVKMRKKNQMSQIMMETKTSQNKHKRRKQQK